MLHYQRKYILCWAISMVRHNCCHCLWCYRTRVDLQNVNS